MDPSFVPFVNSMWFERTFISDSRIHLIADPSTDFVTSGIGNIANVYSYYEPIASLNKTGDTEIKKIVAKEEHEQFGEGQIKNSDETGFDQKR